MRKTFSDCRRTSSAPMNTSHWRPSSAVTVAVATPCCPAPVSAMMRGLPMRRASKRLADGVVDLVRAGVTEVFALQVDLRAAELLA